MQKLAVDKPTEVVSFGEVNKILKKFNHKYIKPFNILIGLTIIGTSFLVLTALLIFFSIIYQS